jgi:uncharacterized protein (TIGR03000 family)
MIRQAFSYGGILLLAGAAVLATPGFGQAQHFGVTQFGASHVLGPRFGQAHFGGAYFGGYRGSSYRSPGYSGGYGQSDYRHAPAYGYGYYPYSGSYGSDYSIYPYVPSYNLSAYNPGYAGAYGDVMPVAPDDETVGGYQYQASYPTAGSYPYQASYPPVTTAALAPAAGPDTRVYVTVKVPADARVWFGGAATTSTGPVRRFYSSPLESGGRYTYSIKASWNENGQEVTQTQQVGVTPGAQVSVNFPVPPQASASAKGDTGR